MFASGTNSSINSKTLKMIGLISILQKIMPENLKSVLKVFTNFENLFLLACVSTEPSPLIRATQNWDLWEISLAKERKFCTRDTGEIPATSSPWFWIQSRAKKKFLIFKIFNKKQLLMKISANLYTNSVESTLLIWIAYPQSVFATSFQRCTEYLNLVHWDIKITMKKFHRE